MWTSYELSVSRGNRACCLRITLISSINVTTMLKAASNVFCASLEIPCLHFFLLLLDLASPEGEMCGFPIAAFVRVTKHAIWNPPSLRLDNSSSAMLVLLAMGHTVGTIGVAISCLSTEDMWLTLWLQNHNHYEMESPLWNLSDQKPSTTKPTA